MKYVKIRDDRQYNEYCEMHEELTFQDDKGNSDEIELIEILIDEYESRTIEVSAELNPIELLDFLLKENKISKAQLARELNVSRQLLTDLIKYRRDLSKNMIIKLSARFNVSTSLFTVPYSLKKVS